MDAFLRVMVKVNISHRVALTEQRHIINSVLYLQQLDMQLGLQIVASLVSQHKPEQHADLCTHKVVSHYFELTQVKE